jgi:hypothetical protein
MPERIGRHVSWRDIFERFQHQEQINCFPAEAGPANGWAGFYWLNALLLVGPASAGKRPVWRP